MNLIELNRALRQLRLGGMAAVLETRLQQAQAESMAPIDFLSCLLRNYAAGVWTIWNPSLAAFHLSCLICNCLC